MVLGYLVPPQVLTIKITLSFELPVLNPYHVSGTLLGTLHAFPPLIPTATLLGMVPFYRQENRFRKTRWLIWAHSRRKWEAGIWLIQACAMPLLAILYWLQPSSPSDVHDPWPKTVPKFREALGESSGSSKEPFSSASLLVPNAFWDQSQVDFICISREDFFK